MGEIPDTMTPGHNYMGRIPLLLTPYEKHCGEITPFCDDICALRLSRNTVDPAEEQPACRNRANGVPLECWLTKDMRCWGHDKYVWDGLQEWVVLSEDLEGKAGIPWVHFLSTDRSHRTHFFLFGRGTNNRPYQEILSRILASDELVKELSYCADGENYLFAGHSQGAGWATAMNLIMARSSVSPVNRFVIGSGPPLANNEFHQQYSLEANPTETSVYLLVGIVSPQEIFADVYPIFSASEVGSRTMPVFGYVCVPGKKFQCVDPQPLQKMAMSKTVQQVRRGDSLVSTIHDFDTYKKCYVACSDLFAKLSWDFRPNTLTFTLKPQTTFQRPLPRGRFPGVGGPPRAPSPLSGAGIPGAGQSSSAGPSLRGPSPLSGAGSPGLYAPQAAGGAGPSSAAGPSLHGPSPLSGAGSPGLYTPQAAGGAGPSAQQQQPSGPIKSGFYHMHPQTAAAGPSGTNPGFHPGPTMYYLPNGAPVIPVLHPDYLQHQQMLQQQQQIQRHQQMQQHVQQQIQRQQQQMQFPGTGAYVQNLNMPMPPRAQTQSQIPPSNVQQFPNPPPQSQIPQSSVQRLSTLPGPSSLPPNVPRTRSGSESGTPPQQPVIASARSSEDLSRSTLRQHFGPVGSPQSPPQRPSSAKSPFGPQLLQGSSGSPSSPLSLAGLSTPMSPPRDPEPYEQEPLPKTVADSLAALNLDEDHRRTV